MVAAGLLAAFLSTVLDGASAVAAVTSAAAGHGPVVDALQGTLRRAEVERHAGLDQAVPPVALASVMRREQRSTAEHQQTHAGELGERPPHPNWKIPTSDFDSGYKLRDFSPPDGFDMGKDGEGNAPPGEHKLPAPVAQRCYDGGYSGGHFNDFQLFAHGIQPLPPMSIVARIRTDYHGLDQPFLAWKPIKDGDKAKSEFLLTADGNLEFRLHDGYNHWNVSASPKVNLADGRWHTVAVVREGDSQSIGVATLYADTFQVGEGFFEGWASHLQPWATSLQVDLDPGQTQFRGFQGDIGDVRIFDEALSAGFVKSVGEDGCTVAVRPAKWVHSNLGGHGPDSGEQSLRFFEAATFRNRVLDLVVQNLTEYKPKFPERNGIAVPSVGRINLMANKPTRFMFRFVETCTDKDVKLDAFALSFFRANQGIDSGSQEIFTVEHDVDQYFVTNITTEIFVTGSDMDASLTFRSVLHSPNRHPAEPNALNPQDSDDLSQAQSDASFGLRIVRAAAFSMTMEVIGEDGHARDVLFGGNSSIFSQGVATVPL